MEIRFLESEIRKYADRYSYKNSDSELIRLKKMIQRNSYIFKEQLLIIAKWKSPRNTSYVNKNDNDFVKEVTRIALSTINERIKISILTLLDGINWPTASVILHFFDKHNLSIPCGWWVSDEDRERIVDCIKSGW